MERPTPRIRPWLAIALAVGWAAAAGPAAADVVHLVNGSRMVVDGWQEGEDDILELRVGGGQVAIAKAQVTKIEEGRGSPAGPPFVGGDVAPPPPAPPPRLKLPTDQLLPRLRALLKQGEALFGDRVLTPAQKTRAALWLDERWRELDVPAVLAEAYGRGTQALRLLVDALAAQGDADAATRLDEAVLAVRTAGTGLSRGVPDRAKEEEPWDTR